MGEANLIGPNPLANAESRRRSIPKGRAPPIGSLMPNIREGVPGKVAKKGKLCNYISISKNKSRHQSVRVEEMFRSMKKP